MAISVLETISNECSVAADAVGRSVVAVYSRRWMPASGLVWRKGVIVTADHTIRREEEIPVIGQNGTRLQASIAGRDPSTDLAVLKVVDDSAFPVAPLADNPEIKLGQFILALGRARSTNVVASAGIIGGSSGEWRTWRGGRVDQHIRLDLNLYPGFSGGPLVSTQGKVLGINTRGLGRGRPIAIPVSTVNRVVDELLRHGHIARPYLGLAMQPASLPESFRGKLASAGESALLVVHVEPSGPADKAGALLGDLVVELEGKRAENMRQVQELLSSAKIGDKVALTLLRGGSPIHIVVVLGDRPAR
jgi:S1-C subfamily serine protease